LRIGDQRAISAFTKRLNFAGVKGLLDGTPDFEQHELWTNDLGKALLDQITDESGISFNYKTCEFVIHRDRAKIRMEVAGAL
jgi:hypothetical protein